MIPMAKTSAVSHDTIIILCGGDKTIRTTTSSGDYDNGDCVKVGSVVPVVVAATVSVYENVSDGGGDGVTDNAHLTG